jgi:hypothetical protein
MTLKDLTTAVLLGMAILSMDRTGATEASLPAPLFVTPEQAHDVREFLEAAHMYEWSTMLSKKEGQPASLIEFQRVFMRHATPEETYRRMVPVFARQLTPQQWAELAKASRSPAFRKRESAALSRASLLTTVPMYYTAAELEELRRIDALPAMKAYRAMEPKINVDLTAMWKAWGAEFSRTQILHALDAIQKVEIDLATARTAGGGKTIAIGHSELSYLDNYIRVISESLIRISNAYLKFNNELKRVGLKDVLKPEHLMSKVALQHSIAAVEQVDVALDALLREIDAIHSEREAGLNSLDFPAKEQFLKEVNASLAGSYDFTLRMGEANRKVVDQYRRILAFMQDRQGAYDLQDGKISFKSDDDMRVAHDLYAGLSEASQDLNRLIDEQIKKEDMARQAQRAEILKGSTSVDSSAGTPPRMTMDTRKLPAEGPKTPSDVPDANRKPFLASTTQTEKSESTMPAVAKSEDKTPSLDDVTFDMDRWGNFKQLLAKSVKPIGGSVFVYSIKQVLARHQVYFTIAGDCAQKKRKELTNSSLYQYQKTTNSEPAEFDLQPVVDGSKAEIELNTVCGWIRENIRTIESKVTADQLAPIGQNAGR